MIQINSLNFEKAFSFLFLPSITSRSKVIDVQFRLKIAVEERMKRKLKFLIHFISIQELQPHLLELYVWFCSVGCALGMCDFNHLPHQLSFDRPKLDVVGDEPILFLRSRFHCYQLTAQDLVLKRQIFLIASTK